MLELYTEQYIYFYQLAKQCSVKCIEKKDRDLYETTTDTNYPHMQQWSEQAQGRGLGGEQGKLENTEPRAKETWFLNPACQSIAVRLQVT